MSSVIGSMIVLSMILTIGYGYFYFINQSENQFIDTALSNQRQVSQQIAETLSVTGALVGPALGFIVNNTGPIATITSYFITNTATGQVLQFNSGTLSSPTLPYAINGGESTLFNTGVLYTHGQSYTIQVLTSKGTVVVGTYPPRQLSTKSLSSLVAEGVGSLSMSFTAFSFYYYTGSTTIDISHPHDGAIAPYGTNIVFSMQITNNDPSVGTITIDSHTDLWVYQTCQSGCGNSKQITFYVINVASSGAITSTSKGSFVPIQIPYGTSATIYFGSASDLSLNSFSAIYISGKSGTGYGEYGVFLLASGSNTLSTSALLYSQNLPFRGTFVADNIGWYSGSPLSCSPNTATPFALMINNSQSSPDRIDQITLNASSFSSVTAAAPPGWDVSVNSGIITWSAGTIRANSYQTFTWSGTAPGGIGVQSVFPLSLTWSSGVITSEQAAVGCYNI